MSYRIEFLISARAELRALPGYVRAEALDCITELGKTPRPSGSKELQGKPAIYRLHMAGRWRIAYHIDDDLKRIRVLRIRRKEFIAYEGLEFMG